MNEVPWRGVIVATALPLRDDLSVDLDRYAEHSSTEILDGHASGNNIALASDIS